MSRLRLTGLGYMGDGTGNGVLLALGLFVLRVW